MIQKCAKLRHLECPDATLSEGDVDEFVVANKGRGFSLKFIVGLDQSSLNHIEKLEEANYDIEMFGNLEQRILHKQI